MENISEHYSLLIRISIIVKGVSYNTQFLKVQYAKLKIFITGYYNIL